MAHEPLRILCWNVYRNYRAPRVAATLRGLIRAHAPQVLLLQEAPVYADHTFADLDVFGGYTGFYAPLHEIRAPAGRLNFVSTGQLLLTRLPVQGTAVHVLPSVRWGGAEDHRGTVTRRVVYARYFLGAGETVGIYNVHLENRTRPAGRDLQAEALLDIIEGHRDRVVVVAGDLNTRFPREGALRRLRAAGFRSLVRGLRPRRDHVLVRGASAATAKVLRGRGSDHAPILATVEL